MFILSGYNWREKGKADLVKFNLQIYNFGDGKEHVKREASFLTEKVAAEWLEIVKENLDDFLSN